MLGLEDELLKTKTELQLLKEQGEERKQKLQELKREKEKLGSILTLSDIKISKNLDQIDSLKNYLEETKSIHQELQQKLQQQRD